MKKHITARRERNRELAAKDALNRCTFCRRALKPDHFVMNMIGIASLTQLPYCDVQCRMDHVSASEARR